MRARGGEGEEGGGPFRTKSSACSSRSLSRIWKLINPLLPILLIASSATAREASTKERQEHFSVKNRITHGFRVKSRHMALSCCVDRLSSVNTSSQRAVNLTISEVSIVVPGCRPWNRINK